MKMIFSFFHYLSDILYQLASSQKEESILRATQIYNNGSYGLLDDGCGAKWTNPRLDQQWVSPDARRKNLTGQRSE